MFRTSTEEEISAIFEEIGHKFLFDWFITNNKGQDNPYHNNIHAFCVVNLVNLYCLAEKLPQNERICLLIAALFHDFNHSGGILSDRLNVLIAMMRLKFAVRINNLGKGNKITDYERDYILQLISSTEYPYKPIHNQFLRVLREADILSYEHENWHEHVFKGICEEKGLDISDNEEELLNRLLEFHEKLIDEEIKLPFFKEFVDKNLKEFENDLRNHCILS